MNLQRNQILTRGLINGPLGNTCRDAVGNSSRSRLAVCVLLQLALASPASAELIVTSSAPPGMPLVVAPGEISAPLLLSVLDNGAGPPPGPDDRLSGWQLTLVIVPDAGSNGTLRFESASVPGSNYLLSTAVNFGLQTIPSPPNTAGDTLTAFDFMVISGVDVPVSPGAGVLELELHASPDTSGKFGLFLAGGPGLTEWSDIMLNVREFANIASTGLTRIADVRAVPEPAIPAMLVCVSLVLLFRRHT